MTNLPRPLALTLTLTLLASGTVAAQSNEGSITADLKNERLVREFYDRFSESWNDHDTKALAEMWAIDGDHLEPDGTRAKGRTDVALLLQRQHDSVFKKTRLNLSIADVWFIGADMALIDGGYELHGIQTPDGRNIGARRGHLTAVLLKEQGKWWIAASRLMIPTELPYKKKK